MKKFLVTVLISLLLASSAYAKKPEGRYVEAIKGEQNGKQGWTFVYNLCVPMPQPAKCDKRKVGLFVPKGDEAAGMPYIRRSKTVVTIKDAKIEADARADMIENVKK